MLSFDGFYYESIIARYDVSFFNTYITMFWQSL